MYWIVSKHFACSLISSNAYAIWIKFRNIIWSCVWIWVKSFLGFGNVNGLKNKEEEEDQDAGELMREYLISFTDILRKINTRSDD